MLSVLEAVKTGNVEIVKVLIRHGEAIDNSIDDGTTPLFIAQNGH
jgi:ankyrin repeat protein